MSEKDTQSPHIRAALIEKTLRAIAMQRLSSEITETTLVVNDIEGTHDAMIMEARAALKAPEPRETDSED